MTNRETLFRYFDNLIRQVKTCPFYVLEGYVIGACLQSDDPAFREIAEDFMNKCDLVCGGGRNFEQFAKMLCCLEDCGGTGTLETEVLSIADQLNNPIRK